MFGVLKGSVELIRFQQDGNAVVLQRAGPAEIVAEASLFSDSYHCDAQAGGDTRVFVVPRTELRQRLRSDGDLGELWIRHLSRQLQQARMQCETLSLHGVSARLDLWLDRNRVLPAKGEWTSLARELGISREALYREIAKRRR